MNSIFFYPVFAFVWLISLIPYWLLYRISDLLFVIVYYVIPYRKKVVINNLKTSFPEKSKEEIEKIAHGFFGHFCDFLVEIIKVISISGRRLDKRVKWLNPEIIDELYQKQRSVAFVSAHYNNWEMMNRLPAKIRHKCMIIYRPLKSKISGRISSYTREKFGAIMIPMDNIFREALKSHSEKQLFSVWFLADQRPPRASRFWTMFLNHETAFFEGTEKISRKLGMAVVFMNVQKVKRGFYEVTFEKLFDNAAGTHENEVTLACVKKVEDEILKAPEFWLWSHKRFKHSRPANVNLITR
jgi:KDO2-lipid IV(A) lauroyltransferase